MDREAYWVPSQRAGWTLAALVSASEDKVVVRYADGTQAQLEKSLVLPFKEDHRQDVEDMITLSEAHEAPLLYNLKRRYDKDKNYTNIGPVVISVNPFKELGNSGADTIRRFLTEAPETLPPHLFSIALNAYRSLVNHAESQSIIISGESGAGKTEATKIMLKFLTEASGGDSSNLAARILATNPVLEAFGNAKTVRNNNSSRFGKFISIAFDPGGKIVGAKIENYLLETTRVVSQAPTERNYHVFYQLLSGATDAQRKMYRLSTSKYSYLTNGNLPIQGIDDKANYQVLRNSLSTLGVSQEEQDELFAVVAGILLLGNIEFTGTDQVRLKDLAQLQAVCDALQLPPDALTIALTQRLFSGGGRKTAYEIPLTHEQAIDNRDALAKTMYSRLFDYLVQRLNVQLQNPSGNEDAVADLSAYKAIGVLDIYGFEVFKQNSMEQLCINYANEKLHQLFNEHVFKAEQAVYIKEGVPWETIKFVDNQDCIDLIEGRVGVLSMLDEECRIPRGEDGSLLQKMVQKHGKGQKFGFNHKTPLEFQIKHFAGVVSYDISGFLTKNRDTLNKDVVSSMWGSGIKLLHELFHEEFEEERKTAQAARGATRGGRGRFGAGAGRVSGSHNNPTAERKKMTVCKRFQQSLAELVKLLVASERHYVRCIKPNDNAAAGQFDMKKVLVQLQNNGVLETIHMRKAGFASHTPSDIFFKRYRGLGISSETPQAFAQFLELTSRGDKTQFAIGQTKIFLRAKLWETLENTRRDLYLGAIVIMQKNIRTYYATMKLQALRVRKQQLNKAATKMQTFIRCWYARQQLRALAEAEKRRREEERRRREEEERKRREEEERRRRAEEERKRKEEEERIRQELKRKEDEERKRKDEEQAALLRKRREDDERRRKEEELKRKQEAENRKLEEERQRLAELREEEERRRKLEAEWRREEEARRMRRSEEIRKQQEKRRTIEKKQLELELRRDQYGNIEEEPSESPSDEELARAAVILQSHIRVWHAKRHVIRLVIYKIEQLRAEREDEELEHERMMAQIQAQEEESRQRLLARRREERKGQNQVNARLARERTLEAARAQANLPREMIIPKSPFAIPEDSVPDTPEDVEEDEEVVKMRRQVQAHVRESRRQTARKSLMLASLVDEIEPDLADEIIETDVKPNLNVTTTLLPGQGNQTPGAHSNGAAIQRKNNTNNGTFNRGSYNNNNRRGARVNPVFAGKNRKPPSQNGLPNPTYTVQYAPPVEHVEITRGTPKSTAVSPDSDPNTTSPGRAKQRAGTNPINFVPEGAAGNSTGEVQEVHEDPQRAKSQNVTKSARSKIQRAFQPFWNKKQPKPNPASRTPGLGVSQSQRVFPTQKGPGTGPAPALGTSAPNSQSRVIGTSRSPTVNTISPSSGPSSPTSPRPSSQNAALPRANNNPNPQQPARGPITAGSGRSPATQPVPGPTSPRAGLSPRPASQPTTPQPAANAGAARGVRPSANPQLGRAPIPQPTRPPPVPNGVANRPRARSRSVPDLSLSQSQPTSINRKPAEAPTRRNPQPARREPPPKKFDFFRSLEKIRS